MGASLGKAGLSLPAHTAAQPGPERRGLTGRAGRPEPWAPKSPARLLSWLPISLARAGHRASRRPPAPWRGHFLSSPRRRSLRQQARAFLLGPLRAGRRGPRRPRKAAGSAGCSALSPTPPPPRGPGWRRPALQPSSGARAPAAPSGLAPRPTAAQQPPAKGGVQHAKTCRKAVAEEQGSVAGPQPKRQRHDHSAGDAKPPRKPSKASPVLGRAGSCERAPAGRGAHQPSGEQGRPCRGRSAGSRRTSGKPGSSLDGLPRWSASSRAPPRARAALATPATAKASQSHPGPPQASPSSVAATCSSSTGFPSPLTPSPASSSTEASGSFQRKSRPAWLVGLASRHKPAFRVHPRVRTKLAFGDPQPVLAAGLGCSLRSGEAQAALAPAEPAPVQVPAWPQVAQGDCGGSTWGSEGGASSTFRAPASTQTPLGRPTTTGWKITSQASNMTGTIRARLASLARPQPPCPYGSWVASAGTQGWGLTGATPGAIPLSHGGKQPLLWSLLQPTQGFRAFGPLASAAPSLAVAVAGSTLTGAPMALHQ